MKSKNYDVLAKNIVNSKVVNSGGIYLVVPLSWAWKDVYLFFQDGFIELRQVKKNTYSHAFVPCAVMYLDQYVLVRLKNYKTPDPIMCQCGCNEYFHPKIKGSKYKFRHYVNKINKVYQ